MAGSKTTFAGQLPIHRLASTTVPEGGAVELHTEAEVTEEVDDLGEAPVPTGVPWSPEDDAVGDQDGNASTISPQMATTSAMDEPFHRTLPHP